MFINVSDGSPASIFTVLPVYMVRLHDYMTNFN
jgi:hypothetical protein